MCLLIETIKVFDKKLFNINFHNQRFNKTRTELFNSNNFININDVIKFPDNLDKGLYKCRILYNEKIRNVEFFPYQMKNIKSLKIVFSDNIDYSYKYNDRKEINNLYAKRGNCDDILIVKNSIITDTSFCNIVFYDGKKWVTPSTPLLKGTKREKYLKEKIITESDISVNNLKYFSKAMLINAFFDFDVYRTIPIENII